MNAAATPLVRAATELEAYGIAWVASGIAVLGAAIALGAAAMPARETGAVVLVTALSLFAAFASLLLARRTPPAILYRRILDRAPEAPAAWPREPLRETRRRAVGPALAASLTLVLSAVPAYAATLVVLGAPRDEILAELPAASALVGACWILACAAAALRIASYLRRWERRTRRAVLCKPQRAGLLLHVYLVAPPEPGPAGGRR